MKNKKHRYRKLIFKVFVCLVVVLVILALIGFIIDCKQRSEFIEKSILEMTFNDLSINKSALVVSRHEMLIEAPIEKVWERLTSINNWIDWQSSVSYTQIDSPPEKNVSFVWVSDGISFYSTIHTNKKFESFGWIGTTWGAQAIHNWHFTKEEDKTKVIVEESLQGLFIYIFTDYFQSNLDIGVKNNLEELRKSCE